MIRKATFKDFDILVRFTELEGIESEGEDFDGRKVARGVRYGLFGNLVDYWIVQEEATLANVGAICIEKQWSDWSADYYISIAFCFVEKQKRQKGYFSKLLSFVEQHYKGAELRLIHNEANAVAKTAYLKRGFVDIPYCSMSKNLEKREQRMCEDNINVEVCCDNFESVENAIKGNAKRLELCSALSCGGLSCSVSFAKRVRQRYENVCLFAMVRPFESFEIEREEEMEMYLEECVRLREYCDGLVFGLIKDNNVDVERTKMLVECAQPKKTTFHRAFDLITDKTKALIDLKNCGIDFVLTSGGKHKAVEALIELKDLQEFSKQINGPQIICGSGIDWDNIDQFLNNGLSFVHGSFQLQKTTSLLFKPKTTTNADHVAKIIQRMNKH